jgi:hypothetical protein
MDRPERGRDGLVRRDVLLGTVGAGLAALCGADRPTLADLPPAPARSDRVRRENERPGTTDWQLTYTRVDAGGYRCPWVEGYVTRQSLRAGETLEICVSTDPPGPFRIELYRMGYYGGAGARRVASLGPFEGVAQALPPVGEQRVRECAWAPCVRMPVPEDWLSGVYLGKLIAAGSRCESYVLFIVRDDRACDLLFQCSDNTWNAYNRWPDEYSQYVNGTGRSLVPDILTSFDRPYGKYVQIYDNPLSQGSGEFLLWEYPLAYWLEQRGYDVSYISNADTHADGAGLQRARGFLSVGHDEYWSLEMYRNVERAIAGGLSVAWLSGNTCCFVTPMTPSEAGVPARRITRAGRYGGVSEAEKAEMGPFPVDGPNERAIIGARTVSPFNGSGDWTCALPDHWLFAGTGMRAGEGIPGLVGWEFHGDPAPIPGLEVVARGPTLNTAGQSAEFTATVFPGPKGNVVFNASTIFWAQGLSAPPGHMPPYSHYGRPHGPDARVQRITANLLARILAP